MLKCPQKLGRGIAFWRTINSDTFLGSGTYVQIARFEGADTAQRATMEIYRGDVTFGLAADASEHNFELSFSNMTVSVPDPGLTDQYPQGNWNFFDLFSINYAYQYGAYNLSTYQARTYHVGPTAITGAPEGQLLLRTFGGSPNRCVEIEFYRVKASDLEFPLNKGAFWLMNVTVQPIVNPAYTQGENPEGLIYSLRDFPQQIKNLGIGA